MIEIFYVVIGVCIGSACVIPFVYKTFLEVAKLRAIKTKLVRLDDFLHRAPKCHKNRADDIREHIKQNMDELDDILDGLRTIPRDVFVWGHVQGVLHQMEDVQKELRWRQPGKRADKTDK